MSVEFRLDPMILESHLARRRVEIEPNSLDDLTIAVLLTDRLCHHYAPMGDSVRGENLRLLSAVQSVHLPPHDVELWGWKNPDLLRYQATVVTGANRTQTRLFDGGEISSLSALSPRIFCGLCIHAVRTSKSISAKGTTPAEEESLDDIAGVLGTDELPQNLVALFTRPELLYEGRVRATRH